MAIGYDVDLLKEIRDAKTKRTLDQQALQNTSQEAVAGIHAKATTDQANIHWQTQKDLRQQIIDADKPLTAEEVTGMKIKNDLAKQFGARDMEARVGHEEIVGKNAAYNYNMATKVPEGDTFSYGESKIRNELALQNAATGKIADEVNDAGKARDISTISAEIAKSSKLYETNPANPINATAASEVAATGFYPQEARVKKMVEGTGIHYDPREQSTITGNTSFTAPFQRGYSGNPDPLSGDLYNNIKKNNLLGRQ